jgi:hypothetical protein
MHKKHCIHIDKELIKQWKSEKRGNKTKQKGITREAEHNKIKKLPKKQQNP